MTCVRCQTIEVARSLGREEELIDLLYRQIDRIAAMVPIKPPSPGKDAVPRHEHEQLVKVLDNKIDMLNETIARQSVEIKRLRKQAGR